MCIRDRTYAVKALDLFKRMQYFMETPGILAPKYLDTLPMKGHSLSLIHISFMLVGSTMISVIHRSCSYNIVPFEELSAVIKRKPSSCGLECQPFHYIKGKRLTQIKQMCIRDSDATTSGKLKYLQ